jgi:hypothetical protein
VSGGRQGFVAAPLGALADIVAPEHLFGAWLTDRSVPGAGGAAADLAAALAAAGPADRPPLWREPAFAARLPAAMRDDPAGPAVVVTGQQPGYLGGPLLTLYKIATAVALAAQRTREGRPTVPVFWSGDDDDDLAEALGPVGWRDDMDTPVAAPARARLSEPKNARTVLATCGPEVWAEGLAAALPGGGRGPGVAALLAAAAEETAWGPAQAALLEELFDGTGLIVVRGDDARLHAAAAPIYERIRPGVAALAEAAAARGAELAGAGYHAQIAARSLARPLFVRRNGRRHALVEGRRSAAGVAAADLRPGVMLRSPIQDWLLQPVAVVVGPGELAYLRQLDPVYAELDLPRSPLVPRLAGWILPPGDDALAAARPGPADRGEAGRWAEDIAAGAAGEIARRLQDDLQVAGARAERLAADRARRFRRGLAAMFAGEIRRRRSEGPAGLPPWVRPESRRQERRLGLLAATDRWGAELLAAVLAVAAQHLETGATGAWHEWALTVGTREEST